MACARAPVGRNGQRLHRLAAALTSRVRAEENAIASRYAIEPVRTARPVPEGPKIVAARLFEPPEAEAAE